MKEKETKTEETVNRQEPMKSVLGRRKVLWWKAFMEQVGRVRAGSERVKELRVMRVVN